MFFIRLCPRKSQAMRVQYRQWKGHFQTLIRIVSFLDIYPILCTFPFIGSISQCGPALATIGAVVEKSFDTDSTQRPPSCIFDDTLCVYTRLFIIDFFNNMFSVFVHTEITVDQLILSSQAICFSSQHLFPFCTVFLFLDRSRSIFLEYERSVSFSFLQKTFNNDGVAECDRNTCFWLTSIGLEL